MNSKNIAKSLNAKLTDWCKHIDDEAVVKAIKNDAIITGGAIVSLLQGETPNDYDVYFKTLETCKLVSQYYVDKWNADDKHTKKVRIKIENDRVMLVIGQGRGDGAVIENGEGGIDDITEPYTSENEETPTAENPEIEKPRYRPRYFSTNALSLSDKIQVVIRFWGEVDKIHENYDFEHCKCSYDWKENKVNLPVKALECIINKELYYSGSKYPLCSIIRTRKFINRGWSINAGQYVKMALQLNEYNLKDLSVFRDQLVGVDSAYFEAVIEYLQAKKEKDPDFEVDNEYLFEVINRIF